MIFHFQIQRIHILKALLVLAVCVFLFQHKLTRVVRLFKGTYQVEQRLSQYGPIVRERLADDFKRVGCPYPPAKLLLVGFKEEKLLEVWVKPNENKEYTLLRVYPIKGASGKIGPKLKEGDGQVPEGIYRIDWLNPNSAFHLSMHIDYPNEYDKARAAEDGRKNLGGDIMIHGGRGSSGCLAMGDEAAEDLFVLVAKTGLSNVEVILSPFDFRKRDLPEAMKLRVPAWTTELYRIIKEQLYNATNKPFDLPHADLIEALQEDGYFD